MNLDQKWRGMIAERCGGEDFDAPGGGYAFSDVLDEEERLAEANITSDKSSALLTLSIADPTWKMHPSAMDAAMDYYLKSKQATRYTDNAGIRKCEEIGIFKSTHEQLAEYLYRRFSGSNFQFTPDCVQYSPGSIKRALAEFIPSTFFDPKTVLFFPAPGYPVIKDPKNNRGAIIQDIAMENSNNSWHISLAKFEQSSEFSRRKKYIYINKPHNPTAIGFRREDWRTVINWAIKHDVKLIVDEAYIDLCYKENIVSVLTIPGWEECCIVLQSVSKGWNATGLRFGWVVGHPTVIKALRKVTDVKDSGMFGPSIAAGLKCLENLEWADETRGRYRELHQLLNNGLKSAGFNAPMPDAGLCQLTPAPMVADGVEFYDSIECAKWFREKLRISLMHYTVNDQPWLRWAVTFWPVPECNLSDEKAVIEEVVRRLQEVKFEF